MGSDAARQDAVQLLNDLQEISFLRILLIIALTWAAIYLVRRLLPFLAERGPSQARLYILGAVPVLRLALLVVAVLWIVPIIFNITFQNFLVIAGAASVAVGFAFKDYVSSLIAGVVAIFERPYRPGDWIRVGDDYGEVISVGLRAIRLRTADHNVVTVPHLRLWTEQVSNGNDGAQTLQCVADFWLAPGHDAAAVRAALTDVALTSAWLNYDHPLTVVLQEQPGATHYRIRAYPFDMRDQFQFVTDLTIRGKAAIAACGAAQVQAAMAFDTAPQGG